METTNSYSCPKCGGEHCIKRGFTAAGSQIYYCKACRASFTPSPKKWAYSEEDRLRALRMLADGATGRGVGRQLKMSKANAYRWATELAKKRGADAVDKSRD